MADPSRSAGERLEPSGIVVVLRLHSGAEGTGSRSRNSSQRRGSFTVPRKGRAEGTFAVRSGPGVAQRHGETPACDIGRS